MYGALISDCLVPIFAQAGGIAFFMAIVSKGINILVKAFIRGELVV